MIPAQTQPPDSWAQQQFLWHRRLLIRNHLPQFGTFQGDGEQAGSHRCSSPRSTIDKFRVAAERGDSAAQFELAVAHEARGNDAQTLRWLRSAAVGGHPEAQFNLSIFYLHASEDVIDNAAVEVESTAWMQRAAWNGFPAAQFALVCFYAQAWGVPEDRTWQRLCFDAGSRHPEASSILVATLRSDQAQRAYHDNQKCRAYYKELKDAWPRKVLTETKRARLKFPAIWDSDETESSRDCFQRAVIAQIQYTARRGTEVDHAAFDGFRELVYACLSDCSIPWDVIALCSPQGKPPGEVGPVQSISETSSQIAWSGLGQHAVTAPARADEACVAVKSRCVPADATQPTTTEFVPGSTEEPVNASSRGRRRGEGKGSGRPRSRERIRAEPLLNLQSSTDYSRIALHWQPKQELIEWLGKQTH